MGAPILRSLLLCGEMFGLRVIRHRIFEMPFDIPQPLHRPHVGTTSDYAYRTGSREYHYESVHGAAAGVLRRLDNWREAMGIDWITKRKTLAEAIPPAYSRYIMDCFLGRVPSVPAQEQFDFTESNQYGSNIDNRP